MLISQVVNTVFSSCSYLLQQDGCAWMVDCGDVDRLVPMLEGRLCGVLLTHAHFDHIYGLNTLISLFPSLRVYTCQAGLEGLLSDKLNFSRYYGDPFVLAYPENVQIVQDGEAVKLFDGIEVEAVYTPGHSPDCVTWKTDEALFTGDSCIPGVKTVTNIPHSDKDLADHSEAVIRAMALKRIIYPGHAQKD